VLEHAATIVKDQLFNNCIDHYHKPKGNYAKYNPYYPGTYMSLPRTGENEQHAVLLEKVTCLFLRGLFMRKSAKEDN
jgi:hypothetical protein